MTAPGDSTDMTARVAALMRAQRGLDHPPEIRDLRRVFGGNARRAWSFDMATGSGAHDSVTPCILLSQAPGRHVESDTGAEYHVLQALTGTGVRAPAALALDATGAVTGAPAIVLERIAGRADAVAFLKPENPASSIALAGELADVSADLHGFDWRAAGLCAPAGDATTGLIEDWATRYESARLAPHPPLTHLIGWLRRHRPAPRPLALVHGDLRPGNFLALDGRITALLDWEMAHIGDPAEDVAWIYRDLWSPAAFVTLENFLARYNRRARAPLDLRRVLYFRVFAEVKFAILSVIAAASVAQARSRNLRHIDRAAKVAPALRQAFALIDSHAGSADHAAA